MESMNYAAPQNLYFQQGDELCFQTSLPHHTHIIQDILYNHPPMSVHTSHELQRAKPKKLGAPIIHDVEADEGRISKRKIVRRDIERQRRQEMTRLYMSLRSHLPPEYLKGKRSISDHMTEAANYINHLKSKIQELEEKRDRMRRLIASSNNSGSPQIEGSSSSPYISVRATLIGAAVVIVCELGHELPLSGVLGHELPLSGVIAALVEEGLNVISILSSKNKQLVYSTIECESEDQGVDSSRLEQKLRGSI